MTPNTADRPPTEEEWRALHAAAAKVKELAPWRWMMEDDLFGVDDPETGERAYVSVMGNLGEHTAVALYLGDETVDEFWALQSLDEEEMAMQLVLLMRQVQLSWEDREMLEEEDRAQLKALGLKFRGRGAWPRFRVTVPGYLPWYIDGASARLLTHALEQLLVIAERLREDRDTLMPPPEFDDEDRGVYLYRTRGEDGVWRDEWRPFDSGEPEEPAPFVPDRELLAQLAAKRPARGRKLEYGVLMLPMPAGEGPGERPLFPFIALLIDERSRMILSMEMLSPVPSLEAMELGVPAILLAQLNAQEFKPKQITMENDLLAARVAPALAEVGIKVVTAPTPGLHFAVGQLLGMMGAAFGDDDPFGDD